MGRGRRDRETQHQHPTGIMQQWHSHHDLYRYENDMEYCKSYYIHAGAHLWAPDTCKWIATSSYDNVTLGRKWSVALRRTKHRFTSKRQSPMQNCVIVTQKVILKSFSHWLSQVITFWYLYTGYLISFRRMCLLKFQRKQETRECLKYREIKFN